MNGQTLFDQRNSDGYVLMGAVVFILVILISGFSFFAVASYETRQAIYRQNSSEAFYLADGAVERARAALLADGTWRDGFANEAAGNGLYNLSAVDSSFAGEDALFIKAEGRVSQASREIEVMAAVQPTAFGMTLLIMGDADVGGNLCIEGPPIHVNGDPDFGPNDVHLHCGEASSNFDLLPPPIRTEPGAFPDATYYDVRGFRQGANVHARIFDAFGTDITSALGDSLEDVISYNNGQKTFTYDFDKHNLINDYFDVDSGLFSRLPGDVSVVVNFGNTPVSNPPGALGISNVIFDGNASTTINATIINTRFTGATDAERFDTNFWMGGLTTVKQIIFEPFYGLSLIPHDFQKQGGSQVQMGTEDWPALVYVTGEIEAMNSNYEHVGGLITLGDWNSNGSPHVVYDSNFLANLPGWLIEDWQEGQSGTMRILRWREVAVGN